MPSHVKTPPSPSRRPVSRASLVVTFSLSILLGLLIIEGISRFFESEPNLTEGLEFTLQPYTMFSSVGVRNPIWRNQETNTDILSQVKFNNFGFAEARDFSFPVDDTFVREFGKKPDERLVLITGASVVH